MCAAALGSFHPQIASAQTTVTTIAGSGLSGNRDGLAPDASFIMPIGMAEASNGTIYIADAGGQRIRELTPDGFVHTVAGLGETNEAGLWVEGGYRDGAARLARFNHPSAIAIGPDGALYVADTLNHCIRKIARGQVSTFVGRVDSAGGTDGARDRATLNNPRALAFDDDGSLYVADSGVGLRRISAGGKVTTVPLPASVDRRFGGIAILGQGARKIFLLSSLNGLVALDADLKVIWIRAIAPPKTGPQLADQPLGHPFAVAGLGDRSFLYSDLYSQALSRAQIDSSGANAFIVSALPPTDASNRFGGYKDGQLDEARFDAPMAILRRRDGGVIVADTGNRRLREFRLDDNISRRNAAPIGRSSQNDPLAGGLLDLRARLIPKISSRYYRIAIVGNSYTYWDTQANESIGGLLEHHLNAVTSPHGKKRVKVVTLFPYFETFDSLLAYAHEVLTEHVVDAVLWQINEQTVAIPYAKELAAQASPGKPLPQIGADFARVWKPRLTAALKELHQELSRHNVRFFAVLHPIGTELTPLESAQLEEFEEPYYPTNGYQLWSHSGITQQLHDAVRASGASLLDLYPAFLANERSAKRQPLFGTEDQHFSLQGRILTARALAQALERLRPWDAQRVSTAPNKPSN